MRKCKITREGPLSHHNADIRFLVSFISASTVKRYDINMFVFVLFQIVTVDGCRTHKSEVNMKCEKNKNRVTYQVPCEHSPSWERVLVDLIN